MSNTSFAAFTVAFCEALAIIALICSDFAFNSVTKACSAASKVFSLGSSL